MSPKPVDNKKALKNIYSLLKNYKLKLLITIICTLLSTVFTIIAPLFIGDATTIIYDGINNIIHHTGTIDFNSLIFLLEVVTALYIISAVFTYFQNYILIEISTKISYDLRERMIARQPGEGRRFRTPVWPCDEE